MIFSKLYIATTLLASVFAAPLPSDADTDASTYSIIVYSIGEGQEKRGEGGVPEQVYVRVPADAVASIGKGENYRRGGGYTDYNKRDGDDTYKRGDGFKDYNKRDDGKSASVFD